MKRRLKEEIGIKANSLVLIVDHYRIGQRIALLQLNYFGFSARVVTSCRQAMKAFKKDHYALVLIGWGMPSCDAAAFTRFVRRLEMRRGEQTTIVAVTSHASDGARDRCVALGMDDLISKPIAMPDMQQ